MARPFYRQPSPLPPTPPSHWEPREGRLHWFAAYEIARKVERTDPVHGRLLAYVFVEGLNDVARDRIASQIVAVNSVPDDPIPPLKNLAEAYFDLIIRPFMQHRHSLHLPDHLWVELMSDIGTTIDIDIEESPADHTREKEEALVRDGHRCLITGRLDSKLLRGCNDEEYDWYYAQFESAHSHMAYGHIIPRSINNVHNRHWAIHFWSIMEWYGGIRLAELNGRNMNRLSNGMTLTQNAHTEFDELEVWLEPVDDSDIRPQNSTRTYWVHSAVDPNVKTVTLSSPDPLRYPLPDPRYLAVRAAVSRIAHMSGAIDGIE